MHTKEMPESAGTFDQRKLSERPCRCCNETGRHFYRVWDSSCGGYSDEEHECEACGKSWWVESADS